MGIIFSMNMINSYNKYGKYDMKKIWAIAEIPIGKDNGCYQFLNK